MFGSEKLSKKNIPEPFNRVLEAIFDPWQGFKIFFLKISSIFWKFSKIFKVIFSFTKNHLDGSARLKYWKKHWPQSYWGFGVKIWLFLMSFLVFFGDFLQFWRHFWYRRYFWYRQSDIIFSCFHRLKYSMEMLELARTHRTTTIPYHSKVAFSLRFFIKLQI